MASLTHFDPESLHSVLRLPKPTTIDLVGGISCHICHLIYANKKEFDSHYVKHENRNDEIVYTCIICNKDILGYRSFRGHCYTSHVMKDKFRCDICCKSFSKPSALKDHIEAIHNFKCTICDKRFPSKKELQLHSIIHDDSEKPPFSCTACKSEIDSIDGCKQHIERHSTFVYSCPICNENIPGKLEAREHLAKHYGEVLSPGTPSDNQAPADEGYIEHSGGISCAFCPTVHRNRVEFDVHFSRDHGDQDIVYICSICSKQFEKFSAFSNHCYNHHVKNRFECEVCCKTFPKLSLLVHHSETCKGMNSKLTCGFCLFQFSDADLVEHLRSRHNVLYVPCPDKGCDQIFDTCREMSLHLRQHQPLQWCQLCGLKFSSLAACEKHLDVHRKKSYACPVCTRTYHEKYLILKHVPHHFETVLHVCKICGKVYNAKHRLVEHLKNHSVGAKLHACTYCPKSFIKLCHLQQHLNVHTGSKPYECVFCPKSFASYPNYHKHLRRMHDGQKPKSPEDPPADGGEKATEPVECEEPAESAKTNNLQPDLNDAASGVPFESLEYLNYEPDAMETGVVPTITDKDLQILNESTVNATENIVDYGHALPENDTLFIADPSQELPVELCGGRAVPVEAADGEAGCGFGPEFDAGPDAAAFIDLDDHILPHIDPLLTSTRRELSLACRLQSPLRPSPLQPPPTPPPPAWEPPVITKLLDDYRTYDDRLSIVDADIF